MSNLGLAELGPRLYLEVIASEDIDPGTRYEIDQIGLKDTLRNKKDGQVYIGAKVPERNETAINDIIIPSSDKLVSEKH
jgi:hypothetical protein